MGLKIGRLAERTEVNLQTLRYYGGFRLVDVPVLFPTAHSQFLTAMYETPILRNDLPIRETSPGAALALCK
jgi:hypothetical protein